MWRLIGNLITGGDHGNYVVEENGVVNELLVNGDQGNGNHRPMYAYGEFTFELLDRDSK